jgi:hypothetical protein
VSDAAVGTGSVTYRYPKGSLKTVRAILPAHTRYFDFVGVVVGETAQDLDVTVYGRAASWSAYALIPKRARQ